MANGSKSLAKLVCLPTRTRYYGRLLFAPGCPTAVAQARFYVFYLRQATMVAQPELQPLSTTSTSFWTVVARRCSIYDKLVAATRVARANHSCSTMVDLVAQLEDAL